MTVSLRSASMANHPKSADPTAGPTGIRRRLLCLLVGIRPRLLCLLRIRRCLLCFSLGIRWRPLCLLLGIRRCLLYLPPRDPLPLLVSPLRDSTAPPVSLPWDPMALCLLFAFLWDRLLLQLQLVHVELRNPFSYNQFIFARLYAEVLIVNTIAAGLVRPFDPLHGLSFRFYRQARLAGPSLVRHRYSHRLSGFRCHRHCRPLTRDRSHTCCGKQSLARAEVKNERIIPRDPQKSFVL